MQRATKATPTKLKVLAGNPGKRPLNDREPQPSGKIGACPDWFPADAKLEWNRVVPELDRVGVLTSVDAATVEAHCLAYAEVIGAARRGEPLKAAMLTALRVGAAELGLTPAARAKLVVPQGADNDPAEQFFQ